MSSLTRTQVLGLYKQFIKNANNFNDYNFKNYFLRRARTLFRENRDIKDQQKLDSLYANALKDLGVLKRQSLISQMYTFDKLVVEPLKPKHE
ncbi:hypothetical protein ZYGR_0AK07080 [Zygosaccharomyces rouxii]|uniref:Complex 1 LYR protein domain-containing protein n=1 Tax=Zygosaccharomyces rouxii TaxID=4956 RepID=A0A1Q3AEL0_ZYGRO|nr:hypothetical protein ZYGR_0AK07080 [Zygosaccharomyces rouxii]